MLVNRRCNLWRKPGVTILFLAVIFLLYTFGFGRTGRMYDSFQSAIAAMPAHTEGVSGGIAIPEQAVKATVVRVVDGDTIDVLLQGQKMRIRYIGIDTPETKKPNTPVEFYGREAEQANHYLTAGKTVYLAFDVQRVDKYGRTLAYVWIEPSTFVNAWLVEHGYAQAATFPPNVQYADLFRRFQQEARIAYRGLWSKESPRTGTNHVSPQPLISAQNVIIQTVNLDGEYVVLVNSSSSPVDLSGWRLVSEVGNQTYHFPAGTVIPVGGSLRIASGPSSQATSGTLLWTKAQVWNNQGDPAALYDAKGELIARY